MLGHVTFFFRVHSLHLEIVLLFFQVCNGFFFLVFFFSPNYLVASVSRYIWSAGLIASGVQCVHAWRGMLLDMLAMFMDVNLTVYFMERGLLAM